MSRMMLAGLCAAMAVPGAAAAQDRLIDVAIPEAVVTALHDEGYKAALKKDKDGNFYIESAANGSAFTIQFFNCDPAKGCSSLQFFAWYKQKPWFSAEMANRWNADKRFLKIAIDKDGDLSTFMDLSTLGKQTYANFADTLDWWSVMTGELFKFMDEEEARAAPPAPAAPPLKSR